MYVRGEKESKNEERVGNRQKICEHYTDQNYDLCARVAGKRRKKGGSCGWDRRACAAVRRVPARQKRRAGDCGFVPAEPERFIPDINVARSILSAEKWIKQDDQRYMYIFNSRYALVQSLMIIKWSNILR